MYLSLIIAGERVDVQVKRMQDSLRLHDVTPIGRQAAEYVPSGPRRLDLEGVTIDGRKIVGVFSVLRVRADGALEIEPWTDILEVGGDTQHEAG